MSDAYTHVSSREDASMLECWDCREKDPWHIRYGKRAFLRTNKLTDTSDRYAQLVINVHERTIAGGGSDLLLGPVIARYHFLNIIELIESRHGHGREIYQPWMSASPSRCLSLGRANKNPAGRLMPSQIDKLRPTDPASDTRTGIRR